MDFLTLEMSKDGHQYVLVITDHFTKYAMAVPTKNMTAKTTAEAFFNNFVVHYGFPKRIHSDQGANFVSKLIQELCQISGMQQSRTTIFHPMGNGLCERYNRTLLNMLGTLEPADKVKWKSHIAPLVHAYNCTKHESTGYSPYYIMFGRKPRLALDVVLGLATETENKDYCEYISDLKQKLENAYKLASNNLDHARNNQQKSYNKSAHASSIDIGDRVLVRILYFDGKHKIADKYEQEPYVVISKTNPDIPVYNVQQENRQGSIRTLHRNMLLPIGQVPVHKTEELAQSETEIEDSDEDEAVIVTLVSDLEPVAQPRPPPLEPPDPEPVVEQIPQPVQPVPVDLPFPQPQPRRIIEVAVGNELVIEPQVRANLRPIPAPRRSTRQRNPPQWMRSGDFVTSQISNVRDDSDTLNSKLWNQKAQLMSDTLNNLVSINGRAVAEAMVKLCSN